MSSCVIKSRGWNLQPKGHIRQWVRNLQPMGHIRPSVRNLKPVDYIRPWVRNLQPVGHIRPWVRNLQPIGHIRPWVRNLQPVGHIRPWVRNLQLVGHIYQIMGEEPRARGSYQTNGRNARGVCHIRPRARAFVQQEIFSCFSWRKYEIYLMHVYIFSCNV